MTKKLVLCLVVSLVLVNYAIGSEKPELVVILVADQLRPATLLRNQTRYGKDGGLKRLLSQGLYYHEAYVDHALTLTAPGHASIATGALPSQHGIVGNEWFDREAGDFTTSVYDAEAPLLGVENSRWGVSPGKLMARTLSDELLLATEAKAKVVAVSAKDRGAVFIAGLGGKAFWYSIDTGRFISSTYYFDKLPRWIRKFNKMNNADQYPATWELMHPKEFYQAIDDRKYERPYPDVGRTFPHHLGARNSKQRYTNMKRTPFIDEMILKLALQAVRVEKLGQDEHSDILSVSLSATDYVGHDFGPNSLEAEDNLFRLDRALGHFMDALEKEVSADDIVYVFTADHGVDAIPAYRRELGLSGHRLDVPVLKQDLNTHLGQVLSTEQELVSATLHTGVYFTKKSIDQFSLSRLQREAISWLEQKESVEEAFVLPGGHASDRDLDTLVQNTRYPGRMGDVFILPSQATFFGYPESAATHGTPYQYDRHIPLLFLTPTRQKRDFWTKATQRSIVPTLAMILGVTKPSHASEPALVEVIGEFCD